MEVVVGQAGVQYKQTIRSDAVLSAVAGKNYNGVRGGAGYSGGGGYGSSNGGGDGGENGGDGKDGSSGNGGDGSGFDVSDVGLHNFILTAGKAGATSATLGGGGGKPTDVGGSYGRDYGGGGNQGPGSAGCVLIELSFIFNGCK